MNEAEYLMKNYGDQGGCYPRRITPSVISIILHMRPDACLRLKFLHRQDGISLFYCPIFLMKRALHFVTKLNSRDIQKFNWFWVPFYGLNQSLDPLIKISWIRPCLVRFILNLSYVNNGKLSLYQLRYNITTFCWPSSFY